MSRNYECDIYLQNKANKYLITFVLLKLRKTATAAVFDLWLEYIQYISTFRHVIWLTETF